jgi:hypothetical protein
LGKVPVALFFFLSFLFQAHVENTVVLQVIGEIVE